MKARSITSIIISALFAATVYVSSAPIASADISCLDFDKKTKMCVTDKSTDLYKCVKGSDGKWTCTKTQSSSDVPPSLEDALEDITASNAPNDGKVLTESETAGGNMTFSRANITAPTSDGQTNQDGSGNNQSTALQGAKTPPPGISCGGTCH